MKLFSRRTDDYLHSSKEIAEFTSEGVHIITDADVIAVVFVLGKDLGVGVMNAEGI